MNYRDSVNDGIPDYPQGCNSGWDNSTLFDIGNRENANYWSNDRFVAPLSGSHVKIKNLTSL
jgi:hypothetical protein